MILPNPIWDVWLFLCLERKQRWVGFTADCALSGDPNSFQGLSYVGSHADNNECWWTFSSMICTVQETVKKPLLLCCHSQKVSMNKGLATSCESSSGSSSCFTYLKPNFAPAEQAAYSQKRLCSNLVKTELARDKRINASTSLSSHVP